MIIDWRVQYQDPERDAAVGALAATVNLEEDQAVQSFKDETDINVMMRRFGQTGQLLQSAQEPFYGDFSVIGDYQSALNAVLEAEASFAQLPPKVRERFRNDPGELVAFIQDPANEAEARNLGLLPAKAASLPGSPPEAEPGAPE